MGWYNESMKIKHGDKGFLYTTKSGYALSVQYGGGNYCGNRGLDYRVRGEDVPETSDCEIALWNTNTKDQPFIPLSENETVRGWVPLDLIPHLMIALDDRGPEGMRDVLAKSLAHERDNKW